MPGEPRLIFGENEAGGRWKNDNGCRVPTDRYIVRKRNENWESGDFDGSDLDRGRSAGLSAQLLRFSIGSGFLVRLLLFEYSWK